jgi:tellurite resistance protein
MTTPSPSGRILPLAPASFFAMTLGLAETGNAWRFAVNTWGISPAVGETLEALAALSFVWWMALYINKWINHRKAALAEARDPVQSAFLALIPESLILMALALQPYSLEGAHKVYFVGSAANLAYGAYKLAAMWTQQRQPAENVPPLFLSYTASVLVNALAAGLLGYADFGWMLFGVGAISWLVLDSVLTQQLALGGLAVKTRNFMGIYMAPSVVALAAYQVLSGATISLPLMYALTGYALFLSAALAFAYSWLREQAFAAGYWAYTFGIATLAQGLMLAEQRTHDPLLDTLAMASFAISLLVTALVAIGSLRLLIKGAYYPPAAAPAPAPAAVTDIKLSPR